MVISSAPVPQVITRELVREEKERIAKVKQSLKNYNSVTNAVEEYITAYTNIPNAQEIKHSLLRGDLRELIPIGDDLGNIIEKLNNLQNTINNTELLENKTKPSNFIEQRLLYGEMLTQHEFTSCTETLGHLMAACHMHNDMRELFQEESYLEKAVHGFSLAKGIGLAAAYLITEDPTYNQQIEVDFVKGYQSAVRRCTYSDYAREYHAKMVSDNILWQIPTLAATLEVIKNADRAYIEKHKTDRHLFIDIESDGDQVKATNNGTYVPKENAIDIFKGKSETSTGMGLQVFMQIAKSQQLTPYLTTQNTNGKFYTLNPITETFSKPRYNEGTTFELVRE